jgi:hypothetical protein
MMQAMKETAARSKGLLALQPFLEDVMCSLFEVRMCSLLRDNAVEQEAVDVCGGMKLLSAALQRLRPSGKSLNLLQGISYAYEMINTDRRTVTNSWTYVHWEVLRHLESLAARNNSRYRRGCSELAS